MLKSRRGSYIVEGTILYPLLVSAAVMIFVLFVVYFENTHYIYETSHYGRAYSSTLTGTVVYGMDNSGYRLKYNRPIRESTLFSETVSFRFKRRIRDSLLYRFQTAQFFSIRHEEFTEARMIWGARHLTDP